MNGEDNPFDDPSFNVYANVESFGREKSPSYRMYKGAKKAKARKVEARKERKAYKKAVRKLKEFRKK